MNKRPDELWEVISIRPFGGEPRQIEHVAYKHTKETADGYVKWIEDATYNRGTVETVTKYLREGSPLTPSMDRETALGYLNLFLVREGHMSKGLQYPEELKYVRWTQMFGNTAGPLGGVGGQTMTEFLMEAWVYENYAVVFSNGKRVKVTDNFTCGARY